MFRKKTVFIIGAGCSKEFGFPLGLDLCANISGSLMRQRGRAFENDPAWEAFFGSPLPRNPTLIRHAVQMLGDGVRTRPSIDRYLEFHSDDQYLVTFGKIMIASEIVKAESLHPFKGDPLGAGGWLIPLWHAMVDGVSLDAPERAFENVSFICFNYDRCIEYYFGHAIRGWLGPRGNLNAGLLNRASGLIFHPYGHLGKIENFPFGGERTEIVLRAMASGIKLFTERLEDAASIGTMKATILNAEQIVYLGFGFEAKNMELMAVKRGESASPDKWPRVFGTVYGVSESNQRLAHIAIRKSLDCPADWARTFNLKPASAKQFLYDEVGMLAH
jgi:hypothetical protein